MLRPYKHGDLTGLCGVYSVINATRLVAGLNKAAIIYLEGPKGHWTTVHDATPKQLLLTDLVSYHTLRQGKCTLGWRDKEHPHALYPACIDLLSPQPYTARGCDHPIGEVSAPPQTLHREAAAAYLIP